MLSFFFSINFSYKNFTLRIQAKFSTLLTFTDYSKKQNISRNFTFFQIHQHFVFIQHVCHLLQWHNEDPNIHFLIDILQYRLILAYCNLPVCHRSVTTINVLLMTFYKSVTNKSLKALPWLDMVKHSKVC